jgi:2-dehydropantoate 2-reductase
MKKHIAVLAAGAIGSSAGADLTKAGHDVTIIDQWPAHVEAMKANGIRVVMPGEDLRIPVKAIHLCEVRTLQEMFDIVFLAAKSYDTEWMVPFIAPYLKSDGILVSLQNSLNDEWIAPMIGYERDIATAFELSGEIFEPGRVKRNNNRDHTWLAVGELHGRVTPRLEEVAQLLSAVGITEITTNIWGTKWSKLIVNSMSQGLCGILGIYNWEILKTPELLKICINIGRESMQVGTTLGYKLEPLFGITAEDFLASTDELLEKNLKTLFSTIGKESRCAVFQDHMKRRRSEVDYLNGIVAKKGKAANVPTPYNDAITSLTRQIERGELKPDLENLDKIKQTVGFR